jgi:transposase
MPAAISKDLRKRVLESLAEGSSQAEAVERFKVSRASIVRWLQRKRRTGEATAQVPGRKQGSSLIETAVLKKYVEAHADQTLAEIGKHFGVSGVTIWKRLRQIDYTFKKRAFSTKSGAKKNVRHSRA